MKLSPIILIIILFYFLALLQTSFLVHFAFLGANFIFIVVIIWNIFEKQKSHYGVFGATIAGFFLDLFSSGVMGYNILILLAIASIIKFILKSYVQIPFFERA